MLRLTYNSPGWIATGRVRKADVFHCTGRFGVTGMNGAVTPSGVTEDPVAAEDAPPYSKCCISKSKTNLRFNSIFKNKPKNISIMRTDTL